MLPGFWYLEVYYLHWPDVLPCSLPVRRHIPVRVANLGTCQAVFGLEIVAGLRYAKAASCSVDVWLKTCCHGLR